jgi:hypothetical protein
MKTEWYGSGMAATSYRYLTNISGVRSGRTIIEGTRIGVHDVIALIVLGSSGLILLFRRRTHQAEAGRLLALLANAGEQGLANNVNFA